MSSPPLLIFDFDGVIVDGMPEYWFSSRNACIALLKGQCNSSSLPIAAPKAFIKLRPWVQYGWEMVLLAAEFLREDSALLAFGAESFALNYQEECEKALYTWGWSPKQLQFELEEARRLAIIRSKKDWFALHSPYPWVLERLHAFPSDGIDWAVITTKGRDFAIELLNYFELHPNFVFGHEAGKKIDVLKGIISNRSIDGFVEDRRETLEAVLATNEISSIPCYLAGWGYLKPKEDECNLPQGIRFLSPETMASPLARWN